MQTMLCKIKKSSQSVYSVVDWGTRGILYNVETKIRNTSIPSPLASG